MKAKCNIWVRKGFTCFLYCRQCSVILVSFLGYMLMSCVSSNWVTPLQHVGPNIYGLHCKKLLQGRSSFEFCHWFISTSNYHQICTLEKYSSNKRWLLQCNRLAYSGFSESFKQSLEESSLHRSYNITSFIAAFTIDFSFDKWSKYSGIWL